MRRKAIRRILPYFLFFLPMVLAGNLGGCSGGSFGPGNSGNPAAPGSLSPVGSPTATAPGQQPTDWGSVGDAPVLFLVQVASPVDGTFDASLDLLAASRELKTFDDSHCHTTQGNPIFPGPKPLVTVSNSIPLIKSTYSTNACGQLALVCPIVDPKEGKNSLEISASYNDGVMIYGSDTAKVECVKKDLPPVILTFTSNPIPVSPPGPTEASQPLSH